MQTLLTITVIMIDSAISNDIGLLPASWYIIALSKYAVFQKNQHF